MKIKSNSFDFFKAIILLSIITSLIVGLIFFTQNIEKTGFLDAFSENNYGYTAYTPSSEAKEIYINDQWYIENTNISTWALLGLDKYKQELDDENDSSTTQADFILLVVFDELNETYQTIQINRDTMTEIDVLSMDASTVTGSVFAQITLAHAYGNTLEQSATNVINAISNLMYDIDIDYYVSFALDIVEVVNDAVGGVELEVLGDFSAQYPEMVEGAVITLTGEQALSYVQQRYGIDDQSNVQRMSRQLQYLEALQEKVISKKDDTRFAMDLLLNVSDYIYTEATLTKLQSFIEKYSGFDYTKHNDIDGETVQGDQYMEFYVDEEQLINLVLELYYTPIEK